MLYASLRRKLEKRGSDAWGSGEFGAPRGDRTHCGIDYVVETGAFMHPFVTGRITKFGYVYPDDLQYRYVEVTDEKRLRHRYFYVTPLPVLNRIGLA